MTQASNLFPAAEAGFRTIRPRTRAKRSRISRWYRRHERAVLGASGVIAFFLLWQVGAWVGVIDPFFFSSPIAVIAAGIGDVQTAGFWADTKVSFYELLIGGVLSLGLAVPLGIVIGWYQRLSYAFDPWLNFFNALPRIALLPLVILWVGLGVEMKIFIVFLGGFFSIIMPTVEGVRTVDRQFLDVARSFRAPQRLLLASIVVPATIPFIVTGIRLAVGRMLIGVIVAELFAQTEGLGVMIARAEAALRSDQMMFGILIFTVAGILTTEAVGVLERYFQRWRPSTEEVEEGM